MDRETEERINRPIPFQEFPKMLYHADGRQQVVDDDKAQSALGAEWTPSPAEAARVRAERDDAAAKRLAAQIAKDDEKGKR